MRVTGTSSELELVRVSIPLSTHLAEAEAEGGSSDVLGNDNS